MFKKPLWKKLLDEADEYVDRKRPLGSFDTVRRNNNDSTEVVLSSHTGWTVPFFRLGANAIQATGKVLEEDVIGYGKGRIQRSLILRVNIIEKRRK